MVHSLLFVGTEVSVGSGFSMEQRRAFKADPSLIVGKVITVSYLEETTPSATSSAGTPSLRFPLLKAVHGSKRTV
jgi:DNA ligase-1